MKSYIEKQNYLSEEAEKWKRRQKFRAVEPEDIASLGPGDHLITEKIDGELAILEIKNGRARFASRHGRIRMKLPVLKEAQNLVRSKYALIIGELAAVDPSGKILPFNKIISVIRKPSEETRHWIRFFPIQILQLGRTQFTESRQDKIKSHQLLLKIFGGARYINPVRRAQGSSGTALEKFKEWYSEGGEGAVVHTESGKTYKIKKRGTFDLVVIGMQEGKGKNKNMAGNVYTAFYDGGQFYFAGKVGTGFSDSLRKKLWKFGKKYPAKYGGSSSSELVWVRPKVIIEVKWLRIIKKQVPTYDYQPGLGWRYSGTGLGVIMQQSALARVRRDKKVNRFDLRLEQIPGWK